MQNRITTLFNIDYPIVQAGHGLGKRLAFSQAGKDELQKLLGKGRAKKGMFEGDLLEGELEIGQVSAGINTIQPAADIVREIYAGFMSFLKQPLK